MANETSERRATVNRYFLLIISGLVFGIVTLSSLQPNTDEVLLNESNKKLILIFAGLLGTIISGIWYLSVESYLNANDVRYKELKALENEIEYPFFQKEWERLHPFQREKSYRQIAVVELYTPVVFMGAFSVVLAFGLRLWKLPIGEAIHVAVTILFLVGILIITKSVSNNPNL